MMTLTRGAMALAFVLMLTACSTNDRKQAAQMTSFSADTGSSANAQLFTIPQDQMSHVQVVNLQPATLTRTLRLTGTVAYNAFNTTPVITQVGGPVSRILVVPGQHVKAGQPMLDVSSPDYSQLLDAYLKAADSFRLADKNWARAQDLYQHHAIAQRDLEQAESDRNQAQADLNAAEQGMKILGIKNPGDLAKAPSSALIPVLAPIGGEVVERLVSPGQVVQAGQTQAFTISDLSTVWVLANVYQADLAAVRTGDDVVVETDAYPGSFHGRISYVSPALDPNTRTLQARIVVDNPGRETQKGYVLQRHGDSRHDHQRHGRAGLGCGCATTTTNPLSIWRPPPIGLAGATWRSAKASMGKTQILRGLSAGERVVGDGSLFLQFANSLQH